MDSLGEVGKRMRSAIKAKLVELGNASQTGYIDDELPDYVMIMVANKRSKQQMLTDLNLFLGSNTENFVNWLHQVLQKLQEVTLPSSLASKAKKKIESTGGKKDKKKDKKKGGKEPTITDVIAAELMEKAKNLEPVTVKKEDKSPSPPPAPKISSDDKSPRTPTPPRITSSSSSNNNKNTEFIEFDIPTISEIETSAVNQKLHMKELSQLQELQNRIYETKKKLQTSSSSEEKEGSGDGTTENSSSTQVAGIKPTENSKPSNIISLSAIRKAENETFKKFVTRQKEENDKREFNRRDLNRRDIRDRLDSRYDRSRRDRRSRSSSRDKYQSNSRSSRKRTRSRSPLDKKPVARPSIHERIGSRVSSKRSRSPEVDTTPILKQKIKRPTLSSAIANNAGRSMLLRAMTEAHKSISKPSLDLKKKTRDNIIVNLNSRKRNARYEDEYIPEAISSHKDLEVVYHPSYRKDANNHQEEDDENIVYLNNNDVDLDDLEADNEGVVEADRQTQSPQFIVSLEGVDSSQFNENSKSSKSPTPPPVIKRNKRSVKERIGIRPLEQLLANDEQRPLKRKQIEELEEEECESQRAYNKVKRTKVSPIKFNLTDDENEDGKSRSSSCDRSQKKTPIKEKSVEKNNRENGEEQKRIRLEPSRSFDHVPALLSSVAVPISDSQKPVINIKSKERCKYYPVCVNASCPFVHPTLPCKAFPMCKFGDSCAYVHPRCKFDVSCNRNDCNYTHTPIATQTSPNVASSIVPVQNYKSIQITPNTTICKFFPTCTNTNCIFLHPKLCKFGKACLNKYDCNFYHFETSSKSKFKWVSQQI